MGNVTFNIYVNGSEVDCQRQDGHDHPKDDPAHGGTVHSEASAMTVEFRGLCSFIERKDHYEVYLPSGMTTKAKDCDSKKTKHVATLVIPTRAVDASKTAEPAQVVNVGGTEFGIWPIKDEEVTFSTAGTGLPPFKDSTCIDLYNLNKAPAKSKAKINREHRYGVIVVASGTIVCQDDQTLEYDQDGTTHEVEAAFAVVWTPENQSPPAILFDGKPKIVLNKATTISVTNVSTASAGIEHFAFYYTLIDSDIECDKRAKFKHVHVAPGMLNENTYGCTPPTSGS